MSPAADLLGRRLLAVFAHPDDESIACGGVLAWCAARGARVSVLCLTAGEHGPQAADGAPGARLHDVRAAELQEAAGVLGVQDVEILAFEDGMLPWIDGAEVEAGIASAIGRRRPDLVITFDEDGLYWHPDHIAVHERVTAAVAALGDRAPALYYVSLPAGAMRRVFDQAMKVTGAADDVAEPSLSILGISDPDAFGSGAPAPTLVVQLGEFARRKLAAIQCHRSQLQHDAFNQLQPADAVRLLGVEHYRRARVGATGDSFIERLAARS